MSIKFVHGVIIAITSYMLASIIVNGNVDVTNLKLILIAGLLGGLLRELTP